MILLQVACAYLLLLSGCATFQKDKEEIKKVSHDLIDEAIDASNTAKPVPVPSK